MELLQNRHQFQLLILDTLQNLGSNRRIHRILNGVRGDARGGVRGDAHGGVRGDARGDVHGGVRDDVRHDVHHNNLQIDFQTLIITPLSSLHTIVCLWARLCYQISTPIIFTFSPLFVRSHICRF